MVDTSRISQRAGEAAEKGNYDYAIELYLDLLEMTPEDVRARMALRSVERAKFEKQGFGKGTAVKAFLAGLPNLISAQVTTLFGKHIAATRSYEKYLTRNPFSRYALWSLGRSFERCGNMDAAIVTYEFLRQNRPNSVKVLRQLARIYVERKDIARAMQRYQMILKYLPRDVEAARQVHNLAATESIQESLDRGDSFQDKIRDKDQAVRLEQAQRTVRTVDQAADAIERVKTDLAESPDRPVLWAELGDLHRRRREIVEAEAAYRKAIELDPKNQLYLQKLMDAQLEGYNRRIEEAQARAEANPEDASLAEVLEKIKADKAHFWLGELKRRVEERPTETGLRFELGNVYFEQGLINEATAEFQRVVRDAKYKTQATAMLGACFAARGLDELAIDQFERAIQDVSLLEPNGKEIAYNLGMLYEKVGNLAAAEDAYKKIFETDIGYRDISEKMEKVYKSRRAKNNASNSEAPQ